MLFSSTSQRRSGQGAMIKAGLLSLILALAMQAGVWSIRTLAPHEESPVESAAIQAPRTLVTCPHHQHDCPTDCFCPKTYTLVGADTAVETVAAAEMPGASEPSSHGVLREPSLAACTQHGPLSGSSPSSAVFLATPVVAFFLPQSASPLHPMAAESLREGRREPLLKIPI